MSLISISHIPPQEDYTKELKKQQNRLGNFQTFLIKQKMEIQINLQRKRIMTSSADQLKSFRKSFVKLLKKLF